jgi:hypothetical protein
MKNITAYKTTLLEEILIYFENNIMNTSAIVSLRLLKYSKTIEWNVNLGSIPNDGKGKEVTVNWESLDIDNKGVFYTDSNGLEM